MVCVPCFVIPALLFIWYRFLQPIFLRLWNPFGKVEAPKEENKTIEMKSDEKSCPFSSKSADDSKENEPLTKDDSLTDKKNEYCNTVSLMEFPDTIEEFGYEFSKDGKLLNKDTGKVFEFEVKEDDHAYNQRHYEALGELITPHVYQLLEKRCGLQRQPVPVDADEEEPKTFIFCSENYSESEKLLVLIHGSGVVRAGQWARRLIINDSLDSGTQIPFIERGIKEGYGILVMNTNDNFVKGEGSIRGSENPVAHGQYVWENYVRKSAAKKIALIAHSYGGVVTTRLYEKYRNDFKDKVFAVALTDSVHFNNAGMAGLLKIGRNWITSKLELDTPVQRRGKDIPCVSAGCTQHEMTSWSSFNSIFKFLYAKLLPVTELAKCAEKLPLNLSHSISTTDEEKDDDDDVTESEVSKEESEEVDSKTTENNELTRRHSERNENHESSDETSPKKLKIVKSL